MRSREGAAVYQQTGRAGPTHGRVLRRGRGVRVRSPLIFHDKVDDLLWILSFLQGFTMRWKQGIWLSDGPFSVLTILWRECFSQTVGPGALEGRKGWEIDSEVLGLGQGAGRGRGHEPAQGTPGVDAVNPGFSTSATRASR